VATQRENPLYHQWVTLTASRGGDLAVRDVSNRIDWSFADLRELVYNAPPSPPLLHSNSQGIAFIVDVLRSWRDGTVLLADDGSGVLAPNINTLAVDISHLKVTSGTTGIPRHLQFRPEQIAADANQIIATMGLRTEWPNLGVISLAHSYGFSNLVLPLLLHGIPLWLLGNPLPETLRSVLKIGQPLTLAAVPAMWHTWDRAGVAFTPIQLAISAAAPLPISLEAAVFDRTGIKIHNFYGSSECGGIAYDRSLTPRKKTTFVGTPMNGVSIIIDPPTNCLRITSPSVTEGYIDSRSSSTHTTDLTNNTWLTQDIARINVENGIHVLGRVGDFISIAGHKLSPSVIEDILQQILGVNHCVVFGVPSQNPFRVEDLVACVNLSPNVDHDAIKLAFSQLPPSYWPRHWWHCADLYPDARGKISRKYWREQWIEQTISKTPFIG
jgi:acyl-coenzyme A synthetase/AMP-(fatty) acid ligase